MKLLNKTLFLATVILGFSTPLFSKIPITLSQPRVSQAVVFAPPSNVRNAPNGSVICTIKKVTTIEVWSNVNGWYETYFCGSRGYIHNSQIRIQNSYQSNSASVNCLVTGIRTGQLALRKSPNGGAIAGLDNNNVVRYIQGDFPWYKVQVLQGPNSQVKAKVGWVNANYLECFWD